jgi:hypothetical protein
MFSRLDPHSADWTGDDAADPVHVSGLTNIYIIKKIFDSFHFFRALKQLLL